LKSITSKGLNLEFKDPENACASLFGVKPVLFAVRHIFYHCNEPAAVF